MVLKENYVSILNLKVGFSQNSLTKQETPLCVTELKEILFIEKKYFHNHLFFFHLDVQSSDLLKFTNISVPYLFRFSSGKS